VARELCGALTRHDDRGAIREHVDETITVIIDPITDLRATIWRTEHSVTGVTKAVTITVCLITVRDLRAVVTDVSDPVVILVELVGVRDEGAVVIRETDGVEVLITTGEAYAPLE
jgi:hypothetical protein